MTEETFMTTHELARYIRVHEMTVYRMVKQGRIPGSKPFGHWRFKKEEIDRWIESSSKSRVQ